MATTIDTQKLVDFFVAGNTKEIIIDYNMGGDSGEFGEMVYTDVEGKDHHITRLEDDSLYELIEDITWSACDFSVNSDGYYEGESGSVHMTYDPDEEIFKLTKSGFEDYCPFSEFTLPDLLDLSDPDIADITSIQAREKYYDSIDAVTTLSNFVFDEITIFYDKNKIITDVVQQKETAILDKINGKLQELEMNHSGFIDLELREIIFHYTKGSVPSIQVILFGSIEIDCEFIYETKPRT